MPIDDIRELITRLEAAGELKRITREVDPVYEVSAFCRVAADNNGPALFFEKVKGSTIPIVANVYTTRRRIALGLETSEERLLQDSGEWLENRVEPVFVSREEAPCKEVILRDDEVDLDRLPFPLWNRGDGGPYVTGGILFTDHPQFGRNAGIHRLQVKGKRKLGVCLAPPDHQARMALDEAERRGEVRLEAAVAIGVDPATCIASASDFAKGDYEVAVAGALRNKAVPMVKCETISLEVPATSEIVLEGVFRGEVDAEGPFVEFTGYQTEVIQSPVLELTAITHRRNPILQCIHAGKPPSETGSLWRELEEALALKDLQRRFPFLKALTRPPSLARDLTAFLQIDSSLKKPGFVQNLMLATAAVMGRLKFVVVVDEDIDIFNLNDVIWAINTRVNPAYDVTIVPNTFTSPLDPSSVTVSLSSKMLVDATKKAHFRGVIPTLPPEVLEKVRRELGQ